MKFLFLFFGLLTSSFSLAQDGYRYKVPKSLGDGWSVMHLKESGLKPGPVISSMGSNLVRQKHQIHSYLIVKNGQLVFEEYFDGNESSELHDLRSVTKSIIALLTGIAIEQGLFQPDDPVQNHLAELRESKTLTLEKLKLPSGTYSL